MESRDIPTKTRQNCGFPASLLENCGSVRQLDFDILAIHDNRVAVQAIVRGFLARVEVKRPPMPRASYLLILDPAFRQGPASVRAHVAGSVELAAYVENGNGQRPYRHCDPRSLRDMSSFSDFYNPTHRRLDIPAHQVTA